MKPLILVTNDDGITSRGVRALVEVASTFGEVVVVAPDKPQSAKGHAITLEDPIRIHPVDIFDGIVAYECSGTPVDCVKLAKQVILRDRKPDLVVSGINHGSNASVNILYSGTMSAAMEASLEGVNSVGFSLLNYHAQADFSAAKVYAHKIIAHVLENGIEGTNLYNVNIPDLPAAEIKGIKICRQAEAQWIEDYQEALDPRGKRYFWITGRFVNLDEGTDCDVWALDQGYVSVVPCMHDLTAHAAIRLNQNIESC